MELSRVERTMDDMQQKVTLDNGTMDEIYEADLGVLPHEIR